MKDLLQVFVLYIIGRLNEKYYKTGLVDGIKLVFECMKMW